MASTIVLSGSLTVDGKAYTLAKSLSLGVVEQRHFELAAGDCRELTFDTEDGTGLKFLFLKAVQASDPTIQSEVQLSFNDDDGAAPASGTGWKEVNGLELSYKENPLSTTNNSLYIYNSGNEAIVVDVVAALE